MKKNKYIKHLEDENKQLQRELDVLTRNVQAYDEQLRSTEHTLSTVATERDLLQEERDNAVDEVEAMRVNAVNEISAALGINAAQEERHQREVALLQSGLDANARAEDVVKLNAMMHDAVGVIITLSKALAPNGRGPGARRAFKEFVERNGIVLSAFEGDKK